MKILYPDLTRDAETDSENSEYPAVNVLDDHIKRRWMATDAAATLRVTAYAGADTVSLFGCNATAVTMQTSTGLNGAWATGSAWATAATWFDGDIASVPVAYELSDSGVGSLWAEYTAIAIPHIVTLSMVNSAGSPIYVGVARVGQSAEFPDPLLEPIEGLIDYSIVRELNNGAIYVKKRDIVRTFSFSVLMDRESEFYPLMNIIKASGPQPLAWALLGGTVSEWDFVVYARVQAMPSGTYKTLDYVEVTLELTEVI